MHAEIFKAEFERGDECLAEGQFSEAEAIFLDLLDADPNSAAVLCKLGEIHSSTHRFSTAIAYFDRAAILNPDMPWPAIGRAEVYVSAGSIDLALEEYSQVQARHPQMQHLQQRIKVLSIQAENEATPAIDREAFRQRFDEANHLMEAKLFGEAETIYQELIEKDPYSCGLYCKLGYIAALMERYDQAEAHYRRATELEPQNPWPILAMGDLSATRRDWKPALEYFEQAQLLNSTAPGLASRLKRAKWHVDQAARQRWPVQGRIAQGTAPPLRDIEQPINVVFFWRQNDTGIYGRRQDMILKYLGQRPEIGKILHFDAPVMLDKLNSLVIDNGSSEARLTVSNTIQRFLGLQDQSGISRRVFVHGKVGDSLLGKPLMTLGEYPKFVETCLGEAGIVDNVVAWVCPFIPDFPAVQNRLGFSFIVTDIIDDQRYWYPNSVKPQDIEENYRYFFERADITFTNCETVADWAARQTRRVALIPNGCELYSSLRHRSKPDSFKDIKGPIVGYAGNLADLVDIPLLEHLVRNLPEVTFIFVGLVHDEDAFHIIKQEANVRFLGLIPYEEVTRYLGFCDAAILPHRICPMTDRMNPLKLYVYRALGLPVVATRVANTDDLGEYITVADGYDDFTEKLINILSQRPRRSSRFPVGKQLLGIDWETRVSAMIAHVKSVWDERSGQQTKTEQILSSAN